MRDRFSSCTLPVRMHAAAAGQPLHEVSGRRRARGQLPAIDECRKFEARRHNNSIANLRAITGGSACRTFPCRKPYAETS